MLPPVLDLFGEVVITHNDMRVWLQTVPRIDPDGPRARHYLRGYDVPAKIRAAKLAGVFETLTAPRMIECQSASWWSRMAWD